MTVETDHDDDCCARYLAAIKLLHAVRFRDNEYCCCRIHSLELEFAGDDVRDSLDENEERRSVDVGNELLLMLSEDMLRRDTTDDDDVHCNRNAMLMQMHICGDGDGGSEYMDCMPTKSTDTEDHSYEDVHDANGLKDWMSRDDDDANDERMPIK